MVVSIGTNYSQGYRDRGRAVETEPPAQTDGTEASRAEAPEAGTPLTVANLQIHTSQTFQSRSFAVLSSQGSQTMPVANPFDLAARLNRQQSESLAEEEALPTEGIIEEAPGSVGSLDEPALSDIDGHEGPAIDGHEEPVYEERTLVQLMEEYVQNRKTVIQEIERFIQKEEKDTNDRIAKYTEDEKSMLERFARGRLKAIEEKKKALETEKEWLKQVERGVRKTKKALEKIERKAREETERKAEEKIESGSRCCAVS